MTTDLILMWWIGWFSCMLVHYFEKKNYVSVGFCIAVIILFWVGIYKE